MAKNPVYLWTLPMSTATAGSFPWTLSVVAGTHVCLRGVRARRSTTHRHPTKVTHLCGAPIVHVDAAHRTGSGAKAPAHLVEFVNRRRTGPPEAVLAAMKSAGFNVTHVYG